jgi:hypothetical protein
MLRSNGISTPTETPPSLPFKSESLTQPLILRGIVGFK